MSTHRLRRARRWLGTLLIAWTIITGALACIGSAYAARENDIRILVGALSGPFLTGLVLLVTLGAVRLIERARARGPHEEAPMPRKFQRRVFGR